METCAGDLSLWQMLRDEGLFKDALDGGAFGEEVILRDIAEAKTALHGDLARVDGFLADEDLHQRGLSRAVGPDQAGTLALEERERDAREAVFAGRSSWRVNRS